ncbi:hypothetical protein C0993_011387 [Termitomyces sp. T159_Od127]|nr:hypothetical protein C0993_011387 [Termitomyces sp. T159_Od127]
MPIPGVQGKSVQYADTMQGSVLVHSTPFGTAQPKQGAKQRQDMLSEEKTQHHRVSLAMVTRQVEQDEEKALSVPPILKMQGESSKEPQVRQKSLGRVLDLDSELDSSHEKEDRRIYAKVSTALKHLQLLADRGQNVPRADLTEYIKLFTRIFELELNEYIKRKLAQGTATSTATPAESVDYNALLCWYAPDIAEAMDILNAPRQVNESQQDYEKHQNATRQQANTSGMPQRALSKVETAMSNLAGEVEVDDLPEIRTPRQRVMIKEEECEESIPDEPVMP